MNIIFVLAVTLLIDKSCSQTTLSKLQDCFSHDDTLSLNCVTPDFSQTISFLLNGSPQGSCILSSCSTGLTQSGTTTVKTIFPFSSTTHIGSWTCTYGPSSTSNTLIIAETPCQVTTEGSTEGQSEAKKSCIQVIVGAVVDAVSSIFSGLIHFLIDFFCWCVQCCCSCCWLCCMPFTVIDALAWCYSLSGRYVFNGRVVYGIRLVIVAAISQPITIISAVIVHTKYEEQNHSYAIIVMLLMIPVCPFIADGIYLLCKAFSGQKELIYNKFEDDVTHFSLLKDHSIKFDTIKGDKIWFKVWANDDVLMTLFGNDANPFLNIIIGYGKRHRKFSAKASKKVSVCEDVLGADHKYRIFYLTCAKHCVTVVKVLNGKEETILNWTNTNCDDSLNISDIRISNYMQDLTKDKESKETAETAETTVTEADAAKTAITIRQSGTRGEWIFFIRKGDCLLEDDDDSRWSKNLTVFLVLFLPVAWIMVPILFIKKLKNANGKCDERGQPNAVIATGDKWIDTDVGKNTPNLLPVDLNKKTGAVPDDTEQMEKKAKSKTKQKDSSKNEIQLTQADTENNTVQTEIVQ